MNPLLRTVGPNIARTIWAPAPRILNSINSGVCKVAQSQLQFDALHIRSQSINLNERNITFQTPFITNTNKYPNFVSKLAIKNLDNNSTALAIPSPPPPQLTEIVEKPTGLALFQEKPTGLALPHQHARMAEFVEKPSALMIPETYVNSIGDPTAIAKILATFISQLPSLSSYATMINELVAREQKFVELMNMLVTREQKFAELMNMDKTLSPTKELVEVGKEEKSEDSKSQGPKTDYSKLKKGLKAAILGLAVDYAATELNKRINPTPKEAIEKDVETFLSEEKQVVISTFEKGIEKIEESLTKVTNETEKAKKIIEESSLPNEMKEDMLNRIDALLTDVLQSMNEHKTDLKTMVSDSKSLETGSDSLSLEELASYKKGLTFAGTLLGLGAATKITITLAVSLLSNDKVTVKEAEQKVVNFLAQMKDSVSLIENSSEELVLPNGITKEDVAYFSAISLVNYVVGLGAKQVIEKVSDASLRAFNDSQIVNKAVDIPLKLVFGIGAKVVQNQVATKTSIYTSKENLTENLKNSAASQAIHDYAQESSNEIVQRVKDIEEMSSANVFKFVEFAAVQEKKIKEQEEKRQIKILFQEEKRQIKILFQEAIGLNGIVNKS